MMLFKEEISGIEDWGRIFQTKEVFEPMVKEIFQRHDLQYPGMENCTPGSNAVFKAGNYIIKIFAPQESTIGNEEDFRTEKFGIERANRLKVAVPGLWGNGEIEDRYIFRYLILDYVQGKSLADISDELSALQKEKIGKQLRQIVDVLDTPCDKFNSHTLFGIQAETRWGQFPTEFQKERKEYLTMHENSQFVYNHGDLNPDNIIVNEKMDICIIDFADALFAPIELEAAGLICDGFHFDADYLKGFLVVYDQEKLTDKIVYGLLIHDFGWNIIRDNIVDPNMLFSIKQLKNLIRNKL